LKEVSFRRCLPRYEFKCRDVIYNLVFEFFANQFVSGDFDILLDFEQGKDSIVIVGSTDVSYDAFTGLLSVDGSEVASVATGLDVDTVVRGNSTVIA